MILEPGTVYGKYRLLRQLGRGGMGVVYLAEDLTLGRQVALKILDRTITGDPNFEARFRQEARVIASLDHPNIVRIHALEQIDGMWLIDMTYVKGGSLADKVKMGVITVYQVLRYSVDVLDALSCCHKAGIIHRDVKPSNILLATEGRALLSDFGLARLLADHHPMAITAKSSSGLFMGTPRYAPPESWDGHEPSCAWDVYSVGMVLYEAAAPTYPYDAVTPMAFVKQMSERPVLPLKEVTPEVSAELSDLVSAMIEKDVTKRVPNASAALERLLAVPELRADLDPSTPTIVRRRVLLQKPTQEHTVKRWGYWSPRTARLALAFLVLLLIGISLLSFALLRKDSSLEPPQYTQVAPSGASIPLPVTGPEAVRSFPRYSNPWYEGVPSAPGVSGNIAPCSTAMYGGHVGACTDGSVQLPWCAFGMPVADHVHKPQIGQ